MKKPVEFKFVREQEKITCPRCFGAKQISAWISARTCPVCNGTGRVLRTYYRAVRIEDETTDLHLRYPDGSTRIVRGKVEWEHDEREQRE